LPPPTTAPPEPRGFTRWLKDGEPSWSWDWRHLVKIREDLGRITRGEINRLAITTPPQVGKTQQITVRYPLYRMVKRPGTRVIVGTHSDRFGHRIGRWTRKVAAAHGIPFGAVDRQDEFELANGSSWVCRGVGAAVSGLPADLLVVEDPYGTAEDARSEAYRNKVLDWYEEDLVGRLQPGAAVVIVHTRWNPGDLIGVRLETEPAQWTYLKMPALATDPDDPVGRAVGESICPERFTVAQFEEKRAALRDPAAWESLYQCNPTPRGGSFVQREWIILAEPAALPWKQPGAPAPERVRYWDLAGTKGEAACWTSGVLLAKHSDLFFVEDVVRGRWVPPERNQVIKQTAQLDAKLPGFRKTYAEEEPGSSGKETAQRLGAMLAPLPFEADKVTGDKDTRFQPFADQCRLGNVRVVTAPWNHEYLAEICSVPNSRWRDSSDSSGGALIKLTAPQPAWRVINRTV
jgi:predicted phage terminase large subunit-like protein